MAGAQRIRKQVSQRAASKKLVEQVANLEQIAQSSDKLINAIHKMLPKMKHDHDKLREHVSDLTDAVDERLADLSDTISAHTLQISQLFDERESTCIKYRKLRARIYLEENSNPYNRLGKLGRVIWDLLFWEIF
jgi:hypothetical protein